MVAGKLDVTRSMLYSKLCRSSPYNTLINTATASTMEILNSSQLFTSIVFYIFLKIFLRLSLNSLSIPTYLSPIRVNVFLSLIISSSMYIFQSSILYFSLSFVYRFISFCISLLIYFFVFIFESLILYYSVSILYLPVSSSIYL